MVAAGKAVNPEIKFYPLMCFGEIDAQFLEKFAHLIEGVVAAYLQNRKDIERALSFLNDDYKLSTIVKVSFPENAFSSPGDGGFVSQLLDVDDVKSASIMFSYEDSFNSSTKGYHYMQFRVNGKVMWKEDVAGSDVGRRCRLISQK